MSESTCDCCGTEADRTDERTDVETDGTDTGVSRTDGGTTSTDGEPASRLERLIPEDLAELTAIAYGMDATPETLADWVDGLQSWARSQAVWPPSFEDLCHVDDSRHVLELDGETHQFACVMDPLMAPGLLDHEEMVVRSASPVEGTEIEFRIEDGEVEATPSTTVLSLGAAHSVAQLEGDEFAPEEAYKQLCAYANAFPNPTTYEAWAEETAEAATMALPLAEGLELARALVDDG